jgi:hypothetical protein
MCHHEELEHLTTVKARQSSVEDDDFEDETMRTMMLSLEAMNMTMAMMETEK